MEQMRKVLRSKIHRATVTHADLNYEGSITIPPNLLEAAGLLEYEAVHVWNVSAGSRFETYTIKGEEGSSAICVNGAAARLVAPGDLVIIASFMWAPQSVLSQYHPRVIFVDKHNQMLPPRPEVPGPRLAA